MRKISINTYFNNEWDTKKKLDTIKELGFDEFFTGIYDCNETMTVPEQVEYARTLGLNCTMIHCSYKDLNVDSFWQNNPDGEQIFQEYYNQLKSCKGLSENFVVHLNDSYECALGEVGIIRLRKLLELCDECGINLCIENIFLTNEFDYIFRNINHPRLKICFDTGHRNFLTPSMDVIKDYGKHISVLHIHDNYGITDDHLPCGQGLINWEEFAQQIATLPNLVLSAEIKPTSATRDKDALIFDQIKASRWLQGLVDKYEK